MKVFALISTSCDAVKSWSVSVKIVKGLPYESKASIYKECKRLVVTQNHKLKD